jgi:hypothetical protein
VVLLNIKSIMKSISKLCNEYYVGHTEKSARIRLKQHIRAIIKFKPYIHYTNEVGHHFNLF